MSSTRVLPRAVCAAALIVLLLALPLMGPTPTAVAGEEIALNFGDQEVAMEDFLRAVGKATGQNLVWNPADKAIRGRKILGGVSLRASPGEFMDAVRALLTFYELVMIPVGPEDHEIVLVCDARQTSSILKLKPVPITLTDENLDTYAHRDGLYVTTMIEVEHMGDLRNARNALVRIVTGQNIGNVTEVPSAKAFVVTDFAPNVVSIYRLLKKMDRPSTASTTTGGDTKAFVLEHAKAAEAVELLLSQFGQPAAPTGTRRTPQQVASAPSAPRIAADVRTNRVIVTGSTDEIEKVKAVVDLLDIPVKQPNVAMLVVSLKHIQGSEAAGALTMLIHSTPALWRGDKSLAPSVISHRETNSLLVSGTKDAVARVLEVIRSLDVERK